MANTKACPSCGNEIASDSRFCPQCGTRAATDANFCAECGIVLKSTARATNWTE